MPRAATLVDTVALAIRRLRERGEDAIYEVDVIAACHPMDPWEISSAFRACIERGWLQPSATAPDAFLPQLDGAP